MSISGLEGAGLVSLLEEEEFGGLHEMGAGKPESGFGLQETHGHAWQALIRAFGAGSEVAIIRFLG